MENYNTLNLPLPNMHKLSCKSEGYISKRRRTYLPIADKLFCTTKKPKRDKSYDLDENYLLKIKHPSIYKVLSEVKTPVQKTNGNCNFVEILIESAKKVGIKCIHYNEAKSLQKPDRKILENNGCASTLLCAFISVLE